MILSAVAAVSLIVSGLGIATVMLMTVGERTREIGIKKALGANDRNIRWEFLIEAMLVSWVGSFIGSSLAIVLVITGSALLGNENSGVSWNIVIGITFFSAIWGGICGAYPAMKAAKLCPVDALRRGE